MTRSASSCLQKALTAHKAHEKQSQSTILANHPSSGDCGFPLFSFGAELGLDIDTFSLARESCPKDFIDMPLLVTDVGEACKNEMAPNSDLMEHGIGAFMTKFKSSGIRTAKGRAE